MELEEMKMIWEGQKQEDLAPYSSENALKHKRKTNIFKTAEIVGLLVAYTFAGIILYHFRALDDRYLRLCGIFLVVYLLGMPLYTLSGILKLNTFDPARSDYKHLFEHFYFAKTRLKKAEKISFIVSPFIFATSAVILAKLLININLFHLKIPLPLMILMSIAFFGAVLFNIRAFNKRETQFNSLKQLLEEDH